VLVLGLTALTASPAAGADLLPDLVAPAATSPALSVEGLGGQDHLLLRFDGYIRNVGAGPLEIRGSSPANGVMTVTGQRIYRDDYSYYDDGSRHPQIYFENSDGHLHWHLRGAARFSLWNEAGTAAVAPGAKVGFCLLDVDRVDGSGPTSRVYSSAATEYCRQQQPNASSVFEGISPGWQDVYVARLPFQWVDVSDVAPGRYRIGAQVDPDDFVREGNEANNGPTLAGASVTLPGYAALPGAATTKGPLPIALGAAPYGSPGPATFAIAAAPAHGTLSAPAGTPLGAPQVVYTPKPGFAGSDSFTFAVRDSTNAFPRSASTATVTVTVPARARARRAAKARLLAKVRFARKGRFLVVRAQAKKTGMLRVRLVKGKRGLGACLKRAHAGRRFACRIKLRRRVSSRGAKAVVTLLVHGKAAAVNTFRVPR
jgi:lysyl oxidase/Big-like domain-containing protein